MELKNLTLEELIQIQKEYKKTLRSIEGRILRIKSYNSLKHSKPQKPVKGIKAISSRRAKEKRKAMDEFKTIHREEHNGFFCCASCRVVGSSPKYFQVSHLFSEGKGFNVKGFDRNRDFVIQCDPCHKIYENIPREKKFDYWAICNREIASRVRDLIRGL